MSATPPNRPEVQLDPALQDRILARMREDQAAARRKREVVNYVLLPVTVLAFVISTVLSFSSDLSVAIVANTISSTLGYILYRVNKERIKGWFGG